MKAFLNIITYATVALAASRTSPPSGCLHVAKSGGTYTTFQAAVNALSTTSTSDQCIFINQGTYTEQVYIPARAAKLTVYGYTTDTTSYTGNQAIITYNNNAASAGNNDASATVRVWSDNFKMYNLNIINSYGKGSQALALSAQSSGGYYGVSLYGFQDTLLANEDQQYYKNSQITGATDFIFGQRAQAWFEKCDIRVRNGGYYITANGRDSSSNPSYYLFNNCNIAAASGESVSSSTYYLGRPWRTYARVVFQNTAMSSVIRSEGWVVWNSDTDTSTVYYAEYNNSGDGATGTRVSWAKKLSSAVSMSTVLGSSYASQAWYDSSY
ncbi:family 8 carbohydrate esterase [Truncatella angustata]|uniref:Pectinesterase n=1 Tax=Truncatella angustata TaxID=152316 RepID=A0A9P8UF29_9PEZI|nr:family 8 carbohydrate esterase [Truncatella angustata]KAH6648797.1 family 8 carbohydrate esterase [Truncatella angustata]